MIRTSVRAAAVAVVASCLVSTVPAVADMTVVRDGAGDARELRIHQSGETTLHRADVQHNVDVRNVKIAHSARKLKFWVRYVQLRRNDDLIGVDFMLKTPERRMVSMNLLFDREAESVLMRRNGTPVRCRGLRAEVQYPQDEFELDIPRRCLGRPDWVKVGGVSSRLDFGALAEALESGEEPEYLSAYLDVIGTSDLRRLSWTERLHRG